MDILKWKKYNIKINLLDGFNVRLDTETEKTSKLVGQNKISILKNKMEKDGQFQRAHNRCMGQSEDV